MTRKEVLRKVQAAERAAEKARTAVWEAHQAIFKNWDSELQPFFMSHDLGFAAGLSLALVQTLRRTLVNDIDSPNIKNK